MKDVNSEGQSGKDFFAAFQRDLKEIGIEVEAYMTPFSDILKRVRSKQAQMWGVAWGADYPSAQNFLQLFYGPFKSPGTNGSTCWGSAATTVWALSSAMTSWKRG